jgi:hypothetical protein
MSSSPATGEESLCPHDCQTSDTGVPCSFSAVYVATDSCRLKRVSAWPWPMSVGTRMSSM